MHNGFKVSVLRYQPNYLLIYDQKYDWQQRTAAQKENEKNLSRGQYNGFMSPKTKSKVRKYLTTWITACEEVRKYSGNHPIVKKPYLTFVTLTLPSKQKHTDNEIKRKCLIPFIQEMQRKFNVWNYFWRAESQQNGNIHFHILIDSYVDAISLRGTWNRHVDKLDYVQEFTLLHKHNNPNSTDIHKLKDINNTGAYLIKYVCKQDGYRPIAGRIHGCSDRVRCLTPYEVEIDNNCNAIIQAALRHPASHVIEGDTYQIILYPDKISYTPEFTKLKDQVKTHILNIGIDLYTNREESEEERAQAEKLRDEENQADNYMQMGIAFDYDHDSSFHSQPEF